MIFFVVIFFLIVFMIVKKIYWVFFDGFFKDDEMVDVFIVIE